MKKKLILKFMYLNPYLLIPKNYVFIFKMSIWSRTRKLISLSILKSIQQFNLIKEYSCLNTSNDCLTQLLWKLLYHNTVVSFCDSIFQIYFLHLGEINCWCNNFHNYSLLHTLIELSNRSSMHLLKRHLWL